MNRFWMLVGVIGVVYAMFGRHDHETTVLLTLASATVFWIHASKQVSENVRAEKMQKPPQKETEAFLAFCGCPEEIILNLKKE